ncbi:DUF2742 domain-containing protein [Mycolicibacterium neoaurum]|uniref:DUF2742 domain-containing protein n=1 Tax=Mycolicibacterium neoaurum TaxID=1795 RepID=UPI000A6B00BC|nr:DUF2742 domain-containing protein [Mycolicibacterium neoaurum]
MSELIVTRAVDWFPVHRLVAPILHTVESWPAAGTLPWQHLADTDPAKWAAVLDAARYGALHMQLRREALIEASHDVAAAADWPAIARALRAGRGPAYIPRKAS